MVSCPYHGVRRTAVLVKRFPKLSETFILGEIASLLARGHDLAILSLNSPNEAVAHPGARRYLDRVVHLDQVSATTALVWLMSHVLRRPRCLGRLLRVIARGAPNLIALARITGTCAGRDVTHIHNHFMSEPAALAAAAAEILGITFSVSAHAKDIYETPVAEIRARLNKASFVTTCTQHNHDYLNAVAGRSNKIHLVYHGIDSEFFQPPLQRDHQAVPAILAVGRFKEKKGFDVLIRACAQLRAAGHEFHCRIVGYGDEHTKLAALIGELALEAHVELCAPVAHPQLLALLQATSVFVLPCRIVASGDRDGIPNSLLEAMAAAVPVVSTRVSGIPEVVEHGVNGLLVTPDNVAGLAAAIARILLDRTLGERLAWAGRSTVVERFSWSTNVATLSRLLEPTYAHPVVEIA